MRAQWSLTLCGPMKATSNLRANQIRDRLEARREDVLVLAEHAVLTDALVIGAHHAKWTTSLWLGDLAATDANCQRAILQYDSPASRLGLYIQWS